KLRSPYSSSEGSTAYSCQKRNRVRPSSSGLSSKRTVSFIQRSMPPTHFHTSVLGSSRTMTAITSATFLPIVNTIRSSPSSSTLLVHHPASPPASVSAAHTTAEDASMSSTS